MEKLYELLETRIRQNNFGNEPKNLYEPMQYIMHLGGKRMRPLLVLLSYQLKRSDPEKILNHALAVEVFHNFTLIHDDIMDKASIRRGQPTIHQKWNLTSAILSGDAMLIKTYDLLLSQPITNSSIQEIISKFNTCSLKVCEGQQLDMDFELLPNVSESQYIEMVRLKTAVLLGFCLEYGGILADMNEKEKNQLCQIGEQMGIGFQLIDDLLDVYGNKDTFGKEVGGDIVTNKKTFLFIKAMQLASDSQKKQLHYWFTVKDFVKSEKIQSVKNIYQSLGILDIVTKKINAYYDNAFNILYQLQIENEKKDPLIQFFKKLIERKA